MQTTISLMAEKPTTVRFKPGTNTGIRLVCDKLGISFNAALSVLVSEALEARGINPTTGKLMAGSPADSKAPNPER
jgi:hypothetical protein